MTHGRKAQATLFPVISIHLSPKRSWKEKKGMLGPTGRMK
jgi:hypothetical protein